VYLVFLLVVRQADNEHVCPSLTVEKEKWENEKQSEISAALKDLNANMSIMQAEAGEVQKKLEKEKKQCVETLDRTESGLQKCTTESETWRKTMTGDMKAKETEYEASLTKLQKQIAAKEEELALRKNKAKASLSKLKIQLAEKDQELAASKATAQDIAKEKQSLVAAHDKEIENLKIENENAVNELKRVNAQDIAKEKQSLVAAHDKELENLKIENDKEIENLKIENDKEIENLKIENDKEMENLKIENDKEMENLKVENKKALDDILREAKEKADELDSQNEETSALLSETMKDLRAKTKELEEISNELLEMKKNFKELRHKNTEALQEQKKLSNQNTEVLKENKYLQLQNANAVKINEEFRNKIFLERTDLQKDIDQALAKNAELVGQNTEVTSKNKELKKLMETWENEFTSIRAKHVKEKTKLKAKINQSAEKLRDMKGDILFTGSWIQVPKGWHGVLSMDLRLFRSMRDLVWSRVFGKKSGLEIIPKKYREVFLSVVSLKNKIPSFDDLHEKYTLAITTVKDFSEVIVREYTPVVKEVSETIVELWNVASAAGLEFYQEIMQKYISVVSERVRTLYVENEIGQLYVDPACEVIVKNAQPIYEENIYPLYQEHVIPQINNIPRYRSQMQTFIERLEKDLRGGWRMTKKWGRVVKASFDEQSTLLIQSSALVLSEASVNGKFCFEWLSAPLEVEWFGGKVSFAGGVFEAAALVTVVLLVPWYTSSSLGAVFQTANFSLLSAYTVVRFVLISIFTLLNLVVYTVAWRIILRGSILSLFYVLSFILWIVGFVLKVAFFPFRIALKVLMCPLKCICCCGCLRKNKQQKSTAKGVVKKKVNGKQKKVSRSPSNDSSTSSDEGKNKKGKRKNKKAKRKGDGSKANTSKSDKKRKKRGGK